MKKQKTLQYGGTLAAGNTVRLHSKSGTASKSSGFGEAVQSWTLRACSAFSVPPGRCPKDFRVFCFFISTACIVFHAFFNQRKTNV
ncbi:hypothetical protein I532_17988 [Brevibacillus borstelensis AK1]|uniref:Uncharacterized protein n=1 Tax=Brevibacillus borstelensis AK1 TaxID=1300222 RepID=M8D5B0_9BACL|nr:hypothetical protein I532_17988 [Brevibacillus borstelensis AK1]